ncbi:hypothetical protein M1D88_10885 [Arthrobacter sp. R1-13]
MTCSNKGTMRRRRLAMSVAAFLLSGAALAACTGPGSPTPGGSPGPSVSGIDASSTPAASPSPTGTSQIGKDGRTVEPGKSADSCSVLSESVLRTVLGSWAGSLQAGQGEVSIDRVGTSIDACVYPLAAGSGTDNSLIVERRTFASAQALQSSDPFTMLMKPEPLSGLQGDARYGVNSLSGSTEYVVVSVSGTSLSRLLLSTPASGPGPGPDEAKRMLVDLARQAGF